MQVFEGIESFDQNTMPVCLTIGNFDGVHEGHKSVISKVVDLANKNGGASALISFDPHPVQILQPNLIIKNIQTQNQFKESLSKLSLDYLFLERFDLDYSEKSATQFFNQIYSQLKFKKLLIGYDFKFGKNQEGNFDFLKKKAKKYSFELIQTDPLKINGQTVSSSLIRRLLSFGQIKEANQFLGRHYEVCGQVVRGEGNGKKLNFPTINLETENDVFLTKGVYDTTVIWNGQPYSSITNFGRAPTVQINRGNLLETHLIDFNQDLYGESVTLKFNHFLRPEKKFSSLEELKNQIKKDIQSLKNI